MGFVPWLQPDVHEKARSRFFFRGHAGNSCLFLAKKWKGKGTFTPDFEQDHGVAPFVPAKGLG